MRCNLLDPSLLTDQHLIAEKRELRMIPPLLRVKLKKGGINKVLKEIPRFYLLGTGHMNWCLDKGYYLERRYHALEKEMKVRGFKPDPSLIFDVTEFLEHKTDLYLDFIPSQEDINIIKQRIIEKIMLKPHWYKFYRKELDLNWVEETYGITNTQLSQ